MYFLLSFSYWMCFYCFLVVRGKIEIFLYVWHNHSCKWTVVLANSFGFQIVDFKYDSLRGIIWEWDLFGGIKICFPWATLWRYGGWKNKMDDWKIKQSNSIYRLQQRKKAEKALNPNILVYFKIKHHFYSSFQI